MLQKELNVKKFISIVTLGVLVSSLNAQAEMLNKRDLKSFLIEEKCQIAAIDVDYERKIHEEIQRKEIFSALRDFSFVAQAYGTGPNGESVRYGYLEVPIPMPSKKANRIIRKITSITVNAENYGIS